MSPEHAVLATYTRNNVLHLFAMPSLIACCFLSNAAMRTEDVQRLVGRIYPYIAAELFLRWSEAQLPEVVAHTLEALSGLGLLETGDDTQGGGLAAAARPDHDHELAIALLIGAGSGEIGQQALEQRCQLMAQRMTMLYGFNSPEFFDRSLFENFIDLLRARSVVRVDEAGRLAFDEILLRVAADAQLVLSEQIRHSILQVTHP